jgi:hypothetical protein
MTTSKNSNRAEKLSIQKQTDILQHMQLKKQKTRLLKMPDKCSDKRTIFLKALVPVNFSIFFSSEKAIAVWNKLPEKALPCLPWGYHWERVEKEYGLYRIEYADEYNLELILYGPDEKGRINYNFLADGKNIYTLAHTRDIKATRLIDKNRKYPDPIKSSAAGYTLSEVSYMPGHCIDHVDSIVDFNLKANKRGTSSCSTYNYGNYIPEIGGGYWGKYMRKSAANRQRKNKQNYSQFVEYPDNPQKTSCGAAIPESVYFNMLGDAYQTQASYWISWDSTYKKQKKIKMQDFLSDFSSGAPPKPLLWSSNSTDRTWRKTVRNHRKLGHQLRQGVVKSCNSDRDQLYAYGRSATMEYENSYSSISAALAASPQKKVKQVSQTLKKAIKHGEKIANLDEGASIIDSDRLKWVVNYSKKEQPGFEDDQIVDAVKQLSR